MNVYIRYLDTVKHNEQLKCLYKRFVSGHPSWTPFSGDFECVENVTVEMCDSLDFRKQIENGQRFTWNFCKERCFDTHFRSLRKPLRLHITVLKNFISSLEKYSVTFLALYVCIDIAIDWYTHSNQWDKFVKPFRSKVVCREYLKSILTKFQIQWLVRWCRVLATIHLLAFYMRYARQYVQIYFCLRL